MDAHPLECAWDMYFHPMSDPTTYRSAYLHVGRVHSCEEWGALWHALPGADVLVANQILVQQTRIVSVSFFRAGAKPEWEDPANAGGTTLAMRTALAPAQAGDAWATLCTGAAGETLGEDVLGVVVAQKRGARHGNLLKFEVWLRAGADAARVARLLGHAGLKMAVAPREAAYPRA